MKRLLVGCRLFTGEDIIEGHALVLDDSVITGVTPLDRSPTGAEVVRLPPDALLAPGFIDVQANGAGGVLLNGDPTEATVVTLAAALRRFGGTGVLPTLITDERAKMRPAAEAVIGAAGRQENGILGIHFEGPFISPEKPGVHDPRHIRRIDEEDLEFLCGLPARLPRGRVLVTLAPEEVEDAVIARLANAGVLVSAGHTVASYLRTKAAIAHGLTGFTHLFNAMPPISSRQPGVAVAALERDNGTWAGIIVDDIHVDPATLRMALAARGPGGLFLVTDAMPPVGSDITEFQLYGQTIFRRGGRLVTAGGTLGGADIDMASSVRNCVSLLGLPLEEALRMASLYPATFLGMAGRYGRLAAGHQADLVLLDRENHVLSTWVGGVRSDYG
ncbi:N-acetylglucosamine 6-phosphate deacetylase [Skermanella stibiiresistens SB22]|uniref:N-acetylglucosamine 6-phosphate deacetylase n=1 Tax=Skermanella stibiiresistens SB22 TaxID=1385369 RepID=W9H7I1_9PROT|nr:N-acetylglucosamine-6-phosphate deacetylase [Skermanella stibiiresistens]EWY42019.1 N-acetylglucosamine 6-phosphate deacetylase [Skermanella stibiiresistens SB22]